MSELVAMSLPERWLQSFLRQDVMYRTTPQSYGGAVRSCGFMLKPDWRHAYSNRVIADLVAILVLRGSGVFEDWHGRRMPVQAGDLIVLPPNRPHGVRHHPDGQWAECYVQVNAAAADALQRLGLVDPDQPVVQPGVRRPMVELFDAILDDLKHAPDHRLGRTLVRVHELLVTAHEMDRDADPADPAAAMIGQACSLLSQRLDQRISIPAIAAQFDLSYERFRKVFRRRMGLSPGEYRIRRRIDRARVLLVQERLSVSVVAEDLGYKDPFTFSRQFKQIVGISPQKFRQSA